VVSVNVVVITRTRVCYKCQNSCLLCSNYSFYVLYYSFLVCFFVLYVLLSVLCVCIVLCIVSPLVYSCLFSNCVKIYRPQPPGGNPIAVNKYLIKSCHIN
jgi:hypothetical protein